MKDIHVIYHDSEEEATRHLETLKLEGGPDKLLRKFMLDLGVVNYNDLKEYFPETYSLEELKGGNLQWQMLELHKCILLWNEMLGEIMFGQYE